MQPYTNNVQDKDGRAVSGATVTVKLNGVNATIYDIDGNPIANPITTGADGEYTFRAANGEYDLTIAKGSVVETLTIQLFDLSDAPSISVNNLTINGTLNKFIDGQTYQIVATRGLVPTTAVSIAGISLHESRLTVKTGNSACRSLRLLFNGFSVQTGGLGEQDLPNDLTVLCAVEKLLPTDYAKLGTLSAQTVVTVKAGSGFSMTDPIGINLDANETFKVQYEARFAASTTAQAPQNVTNTLADTFRSSLATGQVPTAGAWSSTSRTTNQNVGTVSGILGIPDTAHVSVVILGDSIANSRDDTTGDAYGNAGYIPRGLYDPFGTGIAIPFIRATQSGEKLSTFTIGGLMNRLTLLQYCSHVIMNHGTNDLAEGGMTLSTMQSRYIAAWQMIKKWNVSLHQCLIMPRTTSTDSWATAANQTPVANFESGGIRDQLNTWIKAQVGVYIDGYIDPNQYVEDPANPGKWITNGTANYLTADGLHPVTQGHVLAYPAVAEKAALFSL